MYDEQEAAVYDTVYRAMGKDYAVEAFAVVVEILQRKPDAETLLDVACGSGGHLTHFAQRFDVEGVEVSPAMAKLARDRIGVPVHEADMRNFDLGRRFDAVTCLFSAIGYAGSPAQLDAAVAAMARHLNPGGVLAIEAWEFPDAWREGDVACHRFDTDDGCIVRMNSNVVVDRVARMELHYLVGRPGEVAHFTALHELTLFTREEYEAAYSKVGLTGVEYLESVVRRGLFIGTHP